MDSHAGMNPSPSPHPAPSRERPALADDLEQSRRRLAQLIGRLLARQWLRDRHGQVPQRREPDVPALDGPA
jgi:hypothetical protein